MSDKFRNKYRIDSARLKNWDYGGNAAYFVTICTQNKECFLGDVIDGEMILSEIGELAQNTWKKMQSQFPFVVLDAFVVMPNHVHGIIVIDKPENPVEMRLIASQASAPVTKGGITGNKNPMLHENLSRIVRWYKGHITHSARKIHAHFGWQPRFHEHIIRNQPSMDKIRHYILNNPATWKKDTFFPKNI